MSERRIQVIEESSPWQSGPVAVQPGSQLGDYLRVLLRYRRMIVIMVAVSVVLALGYVVARAPSYRADLTLQVEPRSPEYGAVKGVKQTTDEKTFYHTQYNIISSRAVSARVVDQLSPEQAATLLRSPGWFEGLSDTPKSLDKSKHREALIHVVQHSLSVHGLKDSQLVELQFTAPNAELASNVANMVAHAYVNLQNQAQVQITQQAHDWLTGQLDKLRGDLEDSERKLQKFKQQSGLLASKNLENLTSEKLSGTSQKLLDARAKRQAAQIQYQQAKQAKEHGGADALVSVINNPVVQQLKLQQGQARRKLESLETHYGSAAPKVKKAKANLSEVTSRLNAEVGNALSSIEKRYQAAADREQQLQQANKKLGKNIRNQGSQEFQLAKLEREAEVNRNLFQTFLSRVKETSLASQLNTNNIRIIDDAVPPPGPIAPNAKRAVGLALVLSIFLGIALAFIRQNLNQTFRTPRDLESRLSLPGIGVLPKLPQRREGDILRQVVRQPRSPFAEAMGEIRTRIQAAGGERQPQVIMVTSALPGEGKSTLSSNLASAYSQLGKTLLLDADLRKSSLRKLGNRHGLTDLLGGMEDSSKCFAKSGNGLVVMSRGSRDVNPQECLSSAGMGKLIQRLRENFDTIIIDTAPVLAVSDALVLGRYVDGVILAVKAASTPFAVVHDAVHRLRSASINVLGLTLSQVDLKSLLREGGYAYGHY